MCYASPRYSHTVMESVRFALLPDLHSRRRISVVRLICLGLGLALWAQTLSAQDVNVIRIGTGSTAGTYFPIGGLIGNAISNPPGSRPCDRGGSCGVPGLIAVAQSTGGSVENINAVEAGTMEMALSQADVAYWSFFGTGFFEGRQPRERLRALANLFPENIHLIAKAESGIETLNDLKGKRVSLGGPGSGSAIDARLILTAFGLKFGDMTLTNLDLEPSADALVAGEIDAFFLVSGAPALAIRDLAERIDLSFVPIDGPITTKLTKIFPFFEKGVIPAGVYGNNPTTETLDVGALLVVRDDMSDDLAYGITNALWHPNTAPLLANGHPRARLMTLNRAARGVGIKLHPGALRYYVEQGVLLQPAADQADASDSQPVVR